MENGSVTEEDNPPAFLRLPTELRLQIYELVIQTQLHESILRDDGFGNTPVPVPIYLAPLLHFGALLQVSRQTRHDCLKLYTAAVHISIYRDDSTWHRLQPRQIPWLDKVDFWPMSFASEMNVRGEVETVAADRKREGLRESAVALSGFVWVADVSDMRYAAFDRYREGARRPGDVVAYASGDVAYASGDVAQQQAPDFMALDVRMLVRISFDDLKNAVTQLNATQRAELATHLDQIHNQESRLLQLPAEIRLMIYDHVVRSGLETWRERVEADYVRLEQVKLPQYENLIHVCRQHRQDCLPLIDALWRVQIYEERGKWWRTLSGSGKRCLRKVLVWGKKFSSLDAAETAVRTATRSTAGSVNGVFESRADAGITPKVFLLKAKARK